MSKKKLLEIEHFDKELDKLGKDIALLEKRLYAIALHYKHYVDNSFENSIMDLRDNVIFRLFSVHFHLELLMRQQLVIEDRITQVLEKDENYLVQGIQPIHPFFEVCIKEMTTISDSFLYHLTSIFDYLSTFIYFIYGPSMNKSDRIKWTQLIRTCNDRLNKNIPNDLSEYVKKLNNSFVSRLYEYRSLLIHEKNDPNRYLYSSSLTNTKNFKIRFLASTKLLRLYNNFKILEPEYNVTIFKVLFWISNTAIDCITDLLFNLKSEMEKNKDPMGYFFQLQNDKGETLPMSVVYWEEEEYLKRKSKS